MTELHFLRWINIQVARTLVLVGAALATALADAASRTFRLSTRKRSRQTPRERASRSG